MVPFLVECQIKWLSMLTGLHMKWNQLDIHVHAKVMVKRIIPTLLPLVQ